MKTICKAVGTQTLFIISELDPATYDAVRGLYFTQMEDGFAKTYPADTPHLARIYRNFERYAEEMVLQAARTHPVPWEPALLAFLQLVDNEPINWFLTGSAALAARGVDVSPQDLDIVVDGAGARRLGELLLDYLVEPVQFHQDWICDWWGRAFLHARIEWVGDVHDTVDQPEPADFGPTAASRLEVVRWHGKEMRVPLLDLQRRVSERRGLTGRVERIQDFLKDRG